MARKPWLTTDLEDWNLDTKSTGPPGRELNTRPTIKDKKNLNSSRKIRVPADICKHE